MYDRIIDHRAPSLSLVSTVDHSRNIQDFKSISFKLLWGDGIVFSIWEWPTLSLTQQHVSARRRSILLQRNRLWNVYNMCSILITSRLLSRRMVSHSAITSDNYSIQPGHRSFLPFHPSLMASLSILCLLHSNYPSIHATNVWTRHHATMFTRN